MAAPIKLGLVLSGKDLDRFDEYQKNPVCTKKGIAALEEAKRRYQASKK